MSTIANKYTLPLNTANLYTMDNVLVTNEELVMEEFWRRIHRIIDAKLDREESKVFWIGMCVHAWAVGAMFMLSQ